jgi:hypothetical protein
VIGWLLKKLSCPSRSRKRLEFICQFGEVLHNLGLMRVCADASHAHVMLCHVHLWSDTLCWTIGRPTYGMRLPFALHLHIAHTLHTSHTCNHAVRLLRACCVPAMCALQVLAVLDWELATLGNAWADVAYMCLAYHLPHALASMSLTHPLAPGAYPPPGCNVPNCTLLLLHRGLWHCPVLPCAVLASAVLHCALPLRGGTSCAVMRAVESCVALRCANLCCSVVCAVSSCVAMCCRALYCVVLCHAVSCCPGIPTESELLCQYCDAVGRPLPTPQAWGFYLALSLFRLLAILAGVQVRRAAGHFSLCYVIL